MRHDHSAHVPVFPFLLLALGAAPGCPGGASSEGDAASSDNTGSTDGTDATATPTGVTSTATAETTGASGVTSTTDATGDESTGGESTGDDGQHEALCAMLESAMGKHPGLDLPGVAGAARWGIPDAPPPQPRVRRSWSTLSDAEKKVVVDGFLALKSTTTDSGDPGSARADYDSFCEATGQQGYARNLYDYYVEAHANAFVSMMTPHETMEQSAHMGPQFLVWHRYLLLRIEADLAEAIGDPAFALPYWDWTDCYEDGAPTDCAWLFQPEHLGTAGSCDDVDATVSGYMVDQGFLTNIYTNDDHKPPFFPNTIHCGQRPISRKVGCLVPAPPSDLQIAAVFERPAYDAAPYDSCHTDADASFRQFLEGFDNKSADLLCVAAGCGIHGQGHLFVGGDMQFSSANPNDPIFFLHHAQVDRVWAAWQEANLASDDPGRSVDHGNPGYPDAYRGALFNWTAVEAAEMFDYRALGYQYDALPAP